jgi:hypothetical protein
MKLGLICTFALSLAACATESTTDSDEQNSNANNTGCNNTDNVCYCVDQSDCPEGTTCQIANSPQPPYNGICFPDPTCNSNTDPNCTPPPPPGCENNTDPNCTPPPPPPPPSGCENNTDPNCCNANNC